MKVVSSVLLLGWVSVGFSQPYRGCLIDSATRDPIPYARILNSGENTYTFSDKRGGFSMPAHIGDTLVVRHIGYVKKAYCISALDGNCIALQPKTQVLREVVVAPSKRKKLKRIGYKREWSPIAPFLRASLALSTAYALRIKNKTKYRLLKIEVPIRFEQRDDVWVRTKYDCKGLITLQICRSAKGEHLELVPISELYPIEISALSGGEKKLVFEMDEPVILPDKDIFLVFRRILPGQSFGKNTYYHIGPSLFFTTKSLFFGNNALREYLYVRRYGLTDGWVDCQDDPLPKLSKELFEKYYKPTKKSRRIFDDKYLTPLFCFRLTVQEIDG
ncbi:MAG: hypothetical protein V6Z82_03025 [Flavobacteriales bacterium]